MLDPEVKDIRMSVAPVSTHLSQRSQDDLDHSSKDSINLDLLQVTIMDRALILDLKRLQFLMTKKKKSDQKETT